MKAKKQAQAFVKGAISPRQIKAVHAVVHKLGLDDDNYRDILMQRFKAKSCKELSWEQAEELLETLNGKGVTPPPSGHLPLSKGRTGGVEVLKYQDFDGRPGFANGGQCRLIDALWSQVSRAEEGEAREKALNNFVNRIAHVAGLRMLKSYQVKKIVKALEGMGAVVKTGRET